MTLTPGVWSVCFGTAILLHRYNPNRDNPDDPKLSKGWAFFEYFTLPRKYDKLGGHDIRAPPGEAPDNTVLYPAFTTGQASLSDWGIGEPCRDFMHTPPSRK